jgi:hypothetical protein
MTQRDAVWMVNNSSLTTAGFSGDTEIKIKFPSFTKLINL